VRAKFFLAENVPGIISNGNREIVDHAFSLLDDKYEILNPMPIKANEFGAPTTRTRLFFFGYLKDEIGPFTKADFEPPSDVKKIFVKDAMQGLPEKIDPDWQKEEQSWKAITGYSEGEYSLRLWGNVPPGVGDPVALERLRTQKLVSGCFGTVHTKDVVERYAMTKPGKREPISRAFRLNPDGFCPTLTAGTDRAHGAFQALRPIHPTEDRAITPREAARLQGFPDWFQFHPTKWHSFRQIGNSVSPIVAEQLLTVIKKRLE
jgi:DNA (cytosine-5)-methyltransferase 1